MDPFRLLVPATDETFDEAGYLAANPDVAIAVREGHMPSARAHFDTFGQAEARSMRRPVPPEMKAWKLARVRPLLSDGTLVAERANVLDCLPDETRRELDLVETENVSAHEYDQYALALIDRHRDGLVLDCGAGVRNTYYPNVVNYEIVEYDTTDVLGAAERLPFADESFDAVLSLNVLEHVKDPFLAAREIMRVMKPGAELMAVAPFLQPLHGYPHHYYNMTARGLETLFEGLDVEATRVESAMHPLWAVAWILERYLAGLGDAERTRFAGLRVRDLTQRTAELFASPLATRLTEATRNEIATATALYARKSHPQSVADNQREPARAKMPTAKRLIEEEHPFGEES